MDLAKLLEDKGQPDKTAIAKLVEQLAAVPGSRRARCRPARAAPANGASGDWLRQTLGRSCGRARRWLDRLPGRAYAGPDAVAA